jgi:hypothetical protein
MWKAVASCAGLNPSLGKSYCSKDFVMINSEIYWFSKVPTLDPNVVKMERCCRLGVLNPGLVKGQAKVLGDTRSVEGKSRLSRQLPGGREVAGEQEVLLSMASQLAWAKQGLSLRSELIDSIFYHHTSERLKKSHRSWCLPRYLGGLGLSFGSVNFSQRMLASWCLKDPSIISTVNQVERKVAEYVITSSEVMNHYRDKLEVEYDYFVYDDINVDGEAKHRVLVGDKNEVQRIESMEDEPDITRFFIGGVPTKHGKDRLCNLLKTVRSMSEVVPIGDSALKALADGVVARVPRSKMVLTVL